MIRVLHILHSLERGGIQAFLMNVYRYIDKTQIQFDFLVDVLSSDSYYDEIMSLGGRIFQTKPRREGIIKRKQSLNLFFREHPEYRIAHYHASSLSDVMPLQAATRVGIPKRIVHSHNTQEGGSKVHVLLHIWHRLFIRRWATDYFACSEMAARWMYGGGIFKRHEYKVVYNAIELEKFRFNPENRVQLRKELGLNNSHKVIGCIGRFHPQKNHLFLLDVFAQIVQKMPDARLLLVGDGELRPQIEHKIQQLKLNGKVILTGIRKDVPQLLSAMDVMCMPSVYEGLPVVAIEAQANGLHCIISSSITPEVQITDSVNALSLSSGCMIWCKTLINALLLDRKSGAIAQLAAKGYDIRHTAQMLMTFYLQHYDD